MHVEFFYIGCLSYFLFKKFQNAPLRFACFPVSLILGAAIGMAAAYLRPESWDWIPYVIWLVFFSLILDLQRPTPNAIYQSLGKVFDNSLTLYLGKISYSIYLVHVLTIAVCQWSLFKLLPDLEQSQHLLILGGTSCLLTVALSHYLYKYVEKPGMRLGAKFAKSL